MVFVAAGSLSLLLVPLAIRVAAARQVMDRPGGYKLQDTPVPYLGGVAIVVAFATVVAAAAVVRPPVSGFAELATILALAVGLAIVGLVDDLRGLGPYVRLVAQVAAAAAVLGADVGVRLIDGGGPLDLLLTVMWIVGITNAFNLLDNMDGLSAGIATIAAGSLFVIAAVNGQFLVAALAAALAGCAIGFLRHNFHPARIYMGDAGSLFLGFMLSILAIKLRFDAPRQVTMFVPLVVLALPILDTTLVTISRLRHGRNPLTGGRDHLSHRLVLSGLSVRHAVLSLYVAAVVLGWAGLIMSRLDSLTAWLLLGLVTALITGGGVLLGRVPVYRDSLQPLLRLTDTPREASMYAHEDVADGGTLQEGAVHGDAQRVRNG